MNRAVAIVYFVAAGGMAILLALAGAWTSAAICAAFAVGFPAYHWARGWLADDDDGSGAE